jgi:formate dehydrogenase iron-sulfur subunit
MKQPKALLIDITKCIGCEACVYACKEENNLPDTEERQLSATAYTVVNEKDEVYFRRMCMHCDEPTCASVCPVKAFEKTEEGAVTYHGWKCIGCRYCIQACPFGIPTYEWQKTSPLVRKCTMCLERQRQGKIPACAEACPTGATLFGDRAELIQEARKRIREDPDLYVQHIYGEKEAGGTDVLSVSSVPFGELGFPTNVPHESLPSLTWKVMSKIPNFVVVSGFFLYGLYWIIDRRMELAESKGELNEGATSK